MGGTDEPRSFLVASFSCHWPELCLRSGCHHTDLRTNQATAKAADSPPQWAYPENNSNYKPPVDDGKPVRIPNSTAGYTWTQLRTRFIAPVWHPETMGHYRIS